MKRKYMQLFSDIGVFAIGNFLVKLIQFFLLPLYTTTMSTEAYGTAELLNNITEIVFPLTTLAICEAVFRFSIDEEQNKHAVLYESFLIVVKGAVFVFICLSIIQYFVNYQYTYYIYFVILSYSVRMLFANFAKGCGYTKCFSLSGIVNALALAILSWLFLIKLQYGVEGYLLSVGIAHLISATVLLFGTDIRVVIGKREKNHQLLRSMLRYSLPLIPNSVAWWITSMSSRYIVLGVCGSVDAGLYTAANKLPAVISVAAQVFQQSWQLSASREYKNEGYSNFYENVLKVYASVVFIIGAVAICASPILAKVMLKGDFYEARRYVPMMMLSVIVQCMSIYFGAILIAFKQTQATMRGMVLCACINVVLSIALIGKIGIWGVLVAGVLCYLVLLFQRIRAVDRLVKFNKHILTNICLFVILCTQAVLVCTESIVHMIISLFLTVLMLVIVFFSYHADISYLYQKITTIKKEKM